MDTITLPNGQKRPLSPVKHELAQKVMQCAKNAYSHAEELSGEDWTKACDWWVKATRLENAAVLVDEALS